MKYESLPADEQQAQAQAQAQTQPPVPLSRLRSIWHTAFLTGAYSILGLWTFWLYFRSGAKWSSEKTLYSPLNPLIETELSNFMIDPYDLNEYMGTNTQEQEDLWHALSRKGPSLVSAEEAAQMHDPTDKWIGDDNQYLIGVEMFHQLHCLDTMRLAIWAPEPYIFHGNDLSGDAHVDHMIHCIEYLRLSLMCLGDTTVIPMLRNGPWYVDKYNGTRQCRKHEPVKKWVEERSVLETPEFKHWVGSVITGASDTSVLQGPPIIE